MKTDLLEEIDSLLATLEDSAHGEEGRRITELRGKIQKEQSEKPKEEWTNGVHNYGGYAYGHQLAMKNYFVKLVGDHFNGGSADTVTLYDVAKFLEKVWPKQ